MGRGWVMDVRFVLRSLWKSRGYVATAVTVLACTVAANATVYSYVKGTLLADTSFPEPERVAPRRRPAVRLGSGGRRPVPPNVTSPSSGR